MWATKKNPKMEETRKLKTATLEAYFVPWALTADSIYVFSLWHTVTNTQNEKPYFGKCSTISLLLMLILFTLNHFT